MMCTLADVYGFLKQGCQCIAPVFSIARAVSLEAQRACRLYVARSVIHEERLCRVDAGIGYQEVENPPVGLVTPI